MDLLFMLLLTLALWLVMIKAWKISWRSDIGDIEPLGIVFAALPASFVCLMYTSFVLEVLGEKLGETPVKDRADRVQQVKAKAQQKSQGQGALKK